MNYTSVPPHMIGGPDMNDWALEGGIPTNMPPASSLTSMPRVLSSAHLADAAYLQSTPHFHGQVEPVAEPAHHVPHAKYEVMPSDARSDTNVDGPIRCWTDRCNGREFSSIGNYRRHFREQHRVSKKFFCQRCGRPFSRSTARNLHYEKKKCRSIQLDENGVPVSLPLKDGSESEAFSPSASLDNFSSDESRHGSVDNTFSPYTTAASMQGMTYAEPATQPPYVPRVAGEQDMALDWDQLTAWDDGSQFLDDATSWGYLDQPMDTTASTRAYDPASQASIASWNRSGVVGY